MRFFDGLLGSLCPCFDLLQDLFCRLLVSFRLNLFNGVQNQQFVGLLRRSIWFIFQLIFLLFAKLWYLDHHLTDLLSRESSEHLRLLKGVELLRFKLLLLEVFKVVRADLGVA
jgi:hypothetical protein